MKKYWREIALSLVGLVATAAAFVVDPEWGWRVLGIAMLALAAWIFALRHAGYLIPDFAAGHLEGKAAGAVALASAAIGLALLSKAQELDAWSYRVCRALPVFACPAQASCANANVLSVPSPARSIRAVRFTRTCDGGAPTTHVSIVAVGDAVPNDPGNVLVIDGRADLTLLWIDARHLAISGIPAGKVRLQQSHVNGVRISYDARRR